ncbi:Afadin and alpha-actinin-binding-domain-containing protein [Crepidotus variabilis]|uniref:Afadin and alpha-actinin-binding-domain-containing protein n=1 Tax=Crepidotus variabilis TaxID=179855 RepID=A0A9P6JRJ9_9AGAR|nr:Afadin and alpha-actinin-binding-domain-containing protein [Crepidotus variabilis]
MAHKKLVHWQLQSPSLSEVNSLCFDDSSDVLAISTSSLEYVNSQLIAHGFVPTPGLCLDGVSNDDSARLVKCLLSLLGQRVEDMSRTEDLTAKFRTIAYDLERMRSLHQSETEKAANAEREVNMHKSRLAASVKTLQASESSHKQTMAELQRTRTLLQGVRATHQAELKKRDKDLERMAERWQKISDQQAKLSATSSSMRCLNVQAVEGSNIGRGPGFLDIALEESERARSHLTDENLFLRKLVLRTANQIQSMIHQAKSSSGSSEGEGGEPTPITMTMLFPLAPSSAASDKLDEVVTSFQEVLSSFSKSQTSSVPSPQLPTRPNIALKEVERLEGVITKLKEELAHSQKQKHAQINETQAMFDRFAEEQHIKTGEIGEQSMELMSAPLQDDEKIRLDKLRQELDQERQKFTQAAINFGKEKAAHEAERIKFLDEKRSWEVDKMLSDLPPTPIPESPPRSKPPKLSSPAKAARKSPMNSPRKSPMKKTAVGKTGSGRKAHRVSRLSLASPQKIVSYETELTLPLAAPSFPPLKPLAMLSSSFLPTSFVLPPPSPRASLPTQPALPVAEPRERAEGNGNETNFRNAAPTFQISPPPEGDFEPDGGPSTPPPSRRAFPVAKPFAQRMVHAYSPARPSPLSRILMLTDSPPMIPEDTSLSPTSIPVEGNSGDSFERAVMGILPPSVMQLQEPMTLATELGVSESSSDTPMQEQKVERNVKNSRVFQPNPNIKPGQFTKTATNDKGKAKAEPVSRAKVSGVKEKENSSKRIIGGKASMTSTGPAARKMSPPLVKLVAKTSNTTKLTAVTTKPKPVAKPPSIGGPRRVQIDSADAPVIGKARRV